MDVDAEAVELVKAHGGIKPASKATGIPESTLRYRSRRGLKAEKAPEEVGDLIYPKFPGRELPARDIIDYAKKNFAQSLADREARRWFEIKVKTNRPIGVCFMGDPHIDNKGTNWPMLDEHIRVLRETDGMYAIGGNDLTDNWVGRLMRLYADNKMSKNQAWKVAAWIMKDSGVRWLCHVLGNHDLWNDGSPLIKANAAVVPVEDWQARFQIVFPNDSRVRVHMAHDFKGNSQWNLLHAAQKAAMFNEQADIYACAHRHAWAIHQEENPHRNFVYWLIRSRGYKFHDEFADVNGFGSQNHGASVTAVIDPTVTGPQRVQCFAEVGEAAEFLTWKRSR